MNAFRQQLGLRESVASDDTVRHIMAIGLLRRDKDRHAVWQTMFPQTEMSEQVQGSLKEWHGKATADPKVWTEALEQVFGMLSKQPASDLTGDPGFLADFAGAMPKEQLGRWTAARLIGAYVTFIQDNYDQLWSGKMHLDTQTSLEKYRQAKGNAIVQRRQYASFLSQHVL